jgi:hypothetical protein
LLVFFSFFPLTAISILSSLVKLIKKNYIPAPAQDPKHIGLNDTMMVKMRECGFFFFYLCLSREPWGLAA